ncbi:hypothetical protein DsansV1_C23g0179941 [Dioscorea sansibarensis]
MPLGVGGCGGLWKSVLPMGGAGGGGSDPAGCEGAHKQHLQAKSLREGVCGHF